MRSIQPNSSTYIRDEPKAQNMSITTKYFAVDTDTRSNNPHLLRSDLMLHWAIQAFSSTDGDLLQPTSEVLPPHLP